MAVGRIIVAIIAVAALVVGISVFRVNSAAAKATRYDDVKVLAYYRYGLHPSQIVYDVRDLGPAASQAEVLRGLFSFAEALKDREFDQVVLAYRGEAKFLLDGGDFRTIGREHAWQNPIYTLRTFPSLLTTPDGRPAFGSWNGGLLGVVGAQMDDVNELGRRWYLDDLLSR